MSGASTLPTSLAARAVGVSEATIRKWTSRGKLTRHGSPGRAEYDVVELCALAGYPCPPAAAAKQTRTDPNPSPEEMP